MTFSFPTRRSSDLIECIGLGRHFAPLVGEASRVIRVARCAVGQCIFECGMGGPIYWPGRAKSSCATCRGKMAAQFVRRHYKEAFLKFTPKLLYYRGLKARIWTRSEEHTSELQSLMRISYAVFCLNKTTLLTSTTAPSPTTIKNTEQISSHSQYNEQTY